MGQEEKGSTDSELTLWPQRGGPSLTESALPSSSSLGFRGQGWVGALCQAQARVLTAHFPLLHLLAVWLWVTYSTSVSPSVKWARGIPFLGGFGNE